ncbi:MULTISPECIES: 8-oxo-dGTP diphosphatase [Arthrobacter]|uniref:Oxidized purine nucleoside triphosphate hydrolase n=1 Tax=Arthrobacter oryzae TaxID=409290 RepID=A0A3N0BR44_9MICC|nr:MULTISPECIES: 8-oxo-dGTP diphosphatase [Arthrobacter]QYF90679.1 8-oxo-dGTP diphosphatase [Arthrobacter sp. PAMC25284]RNL51500.1 8-oxo-dGTP diphosphatase [Arthrobacter oryzae]
MKWTAVTLCFLLRDGAVGTQVLLGTKKTGFGVGKIVGLGGHVEPGESQAEAACREVYEEAGIVVREHDLRIAGQIQFVFPARPEWNMSTSLFTARRWTGEPAESDEIIPEWFHISSLPLERMWQDAGHWLPLALAEGTVEAVITLNEDNETVASAEYSET